MISPVAGRGDGVAAWRLRSRSHPALVLALLTASFLASPAPPASASTGPARNLPERHLQQARGEYALKAAFLYNFAKFVQWPDRAWNGEGGNDRIVLCVVRPDPFGSVLDDALAGKTAHGRGFEIRRLDPGGLDGSCHILFVPGDVSERTDEILASLGDRPVLTVGESPDFVRRGGIVNFYIADNKVRFEVHYNRSRQLELDLSSRLLALARIVDGDSSDRITPGRPVRRARSRGFWGSGDGDRVAAAHRTAPDDGVPRTEVEVTKAGTRHEPRARDHTVRRRGDGP